MKRVVKCPDCGGPLFITSDGDFSCWDCNEMFKNLDGYPGVNLEEDEIPIDDLDTEEFG